MLKMFSTQLGGLFKRLSEKQEFAIEDTARLLAQAAAGDGAIYIYASGEMDAVLSEATSGREPLSSAAEFPGADKVADADRILIVTRFSDDPEAIQLAKTLQEKHIFFAAISTVVVADQADNDLSTLADVHIDLGLRTGLLPDESGNRVGYPASMAALFVYYGIKFTIDEILSDYN